MHRAPLKRLRCVWWCRSLLAEFLPAASKEREERTAPEQAGLAPWYDKLKWFVALRRVGFDPEAADGGAKHPRLGA